MEMNLDMPIHEQSLLRRQGNNNKHNRKAKQHNTTHPKQSFFTEKLATSGGMYMYMYTYKPMADLYNI